MDGFGTHTFRWMNAAGESVWVKLHLKTDQGIECLTQPEAMRLAGEKPDHHQADLHEAIARGDHPAWTLKVQVMPEAAAANARFDPFDATKTWPYADFPLYEVGRLVLNRNPSNYFAEVEQAAFNPANFVPGVGPSPDRLLQGRLFAYGDAQRYRLGVNHTLLPVNNPRAVTARTYGRDGAMRFDENGGGEPNFRPNDRRGPIPDPSVASPDVLVVSNASGRSGGDDFSQAGDLYRLMDAAAQQRLVDALGKSILCVGSASVRETCVRHFRSADADLGGRLTAFLGRSAR
jgi:catalase